METLGRPREALWSPLASPRRPFKGRQREMTDERALEAWFWQHRPADFKQLWPTFAQSSRERPTLIEVSRSMPRSHPKTCFRGSSSVIFVTILLFVSHKLSIRNDHSDVVFIALLAARRRDVHSRAGRKSAPPAWRDQDLLMRLPGLLGPAISFAP